MFGVAVFRVKTNPGCVLRIGLLRWEGADGHGLRGKERGQGGHRSRTGMLKSSGVTAGGDEHCERPVGQ